MDVNSKEAKVLLRIQKTFNRLVRIFCVAGCFILPFLDNTIMGTYHITLGVIFVIALLPVTLRNALRLEKREWKIFEYAPTLSVLFASWGTIAKLMPIIIAYFYPMQSGFPFISILLSLYVLVVLRAIHVDSSLEEFIKLEAEQSIFP